MTYGELAIAVRSAAADLVVQIGASACIPVGVLSRSEDALVAALAVIASGNIVVAIDPDSSISRLDRMVNELALTFVLHDGDTADAAAGLARRHGQLVVRRIDRSRSDVAELPRRGPLDPMMLVPARPADPAAPEVIATHAMVINAARAAMDGLGIAGGDRVAVASRPWQSDGAIAVLVPLLCGAALVSPDSSMSPAEWVRQLEEDRANVAYLGERPAVAISELHADGGRPHLRMVVLGGRAPNTVVHGVRAALPADECSMVLCTPEAGVIGIRTATAGSTGMPHEPPWVPVEGIEVHVTDRVGRPLANRRDGVVSVASRFLFRGYWGRSDLDGVALTDDPLERRGWRLHRTELVGHLDEHGHLHPWAPVARPSNGGERADDSGPGVTAGTAAVQIARRTVRWVSSARRWFRR